MEYALSGPELEATGAQRAPQMSGWMVYCRRMQYSPAAQFEIFYV